MMMSAHQMQGPPPAQANCPNCQTPLTFPYGSAYIQCPSCTFAFTPQPPQMPPQPIPVQPPPHPHNAVNYINCLQCQALLSYAPTSVTIQCPKCLMIMDIPPARASAVNVTGAGMPTGVGGGGVAVGGGGGGNSSKEAMAARKKRKDPNAPKRASNAYMIFCKERRAQLKQDRPDLPFGQLGKRLGEMWRSMSIEEKKHYEDRATGDRDRYKGEMSSYQSSAMMKGAQRDHGGDRGGGGHRSDDDSEEPVRRKGDSNGAEKKIKSDYQQHSYHKRENSPGE